MDSRLPGDHALKGFYRRALNILSVDRHANMTDTEKKASEEEVCSAPDRFLCHIILVMTLCAAFVLAMEQQFS